MAAICGKLALLSLPPNAPRFVFRVELDADGLVREIHSVLAPDKLVGVAPMK